MSNLEQALQLNLFEELDALPKEFEDYTFSEEYEKYIKRLFDKMRGDKMHRFTKKTTTIILIAAILFALIIAGFAATVGREFIIKTFSDHFEYSITDRSNSKNVTELQVGYIPDGFVFEEERNKKTYKIHRYSNGINEIDIEKSHINTKVDYDSNFTSEIIVVNGIEYVYYSSSDSDWKGFIFNDGNYMFQVEGDISKEELLIVSQNVK